MVIHGEYTIKTSIYVFRNTGGKMNTDENVKKIRQRLKAYLIS